MKGVVTSARLVVEVIETQLPARSRLLLALNGAHKLPKDDSGVGAGAELELENNSNAAALELLVE